MSESSVLIAGEPSFGQELEERLKGGGITARFQPVRDLPDALTTLEERLSQAGHNAAVAIGAGDAAVALAVTASKLGIPLARVASEPEPDPDAERILATLAELDAGDSAVRAADLIAAWLDGESPGADLD